MKEKKEHDYTRYNLPIFIAFLLISLVLYTFPQYKIFDLIKLEIFNYPFKPIEVFFHEGGHLISSLLLGGEILELHLEFNSGYVKQMIGDWASIVAFLGYPTASIMGFLIYYSSIHASKYLKIFLMVYSSFFFIYVDGLITAGILAMILGIFVASWYLKTFGCYLLRFIGVYVMLSSIYSPTYLWAYDSQGDHVSMSEYTMLPSSLFICIWFLIGSFFMYKAFTISIKKRDKKDKIK